MFLRYLLVFLLTLVGISCALALIIFLASAAIYGDLILPIVCVGTLALFFYGLKVLDKEQEV